MSTACHLFGCAQRLWSLFSQGGYGYGDDQGTADQGGKGGKDAASAYNAHSQAAHSQAGHGQGGYTQQDLQGQYASQYGQQGGQGSQAYGYNAQYGAQGYGGQANGGYKLQ